MDIETLAMALALSKSKGSSSGNADENLQNAISALSYDICPNIYNSGSNPEIESGQFFYIDDDMHLRFSFDLIPANSSKEDIYNLSASVATEHGGLSSVISLLLDNAQNSGGDGDKSSITLYDSDNDAITSVISIGTKSGSLQTGNGTTASGENAHAEGAGTTASGVQSHAEGAGTRAIGALSHAEGGGTNASGGSSHAEGSGTTANGDQSHAEGAGTTASGMQSHAEGGGTTATGVSSHAEGGSTTASGAQSHAEGYGGTYNVKQGTTTKTITSGAFYIADHSEGYQTVAGRPLESGETRTIFGAHAEGYHTQATGDASHAEGSGTTASGELSHAEGGGTRAIGAYSHAEGAGTTASGIQSHAEGSGTTASGELSHAEGGGTTASGVYSHAEGGGTQAIGAQSHAEGAGSLALGDQSHAEGSGTSASGILSHAEGSGTTASGAQSHAEGSGTKANHASQHVFGEYNIEDPSTANVNNRGTYVEIVGNGTKSNARSNARTLDWSGNETLAGNLSVGGGSLTLGSGANAVTITATQLRQLLSMLQS